MQQRFETEKQQKLIEEQKLKDEQAISEEPPPVQKSFLPFSLTLPDVEEPMEPLYHHQFYYLWILVECVLVKILLKSFSFHK